MTEPTHLTFKLEDPAKSYQKVNVAGDFNNWDPNINELEFDEKSKSWLLDLLVGLSVDKKVLYKYVTDNNNWMCDEAQPRETDESGIQNNVAFVILQRGISTVEGSEVTDEDDTFDHKSFHDGELFDTAKSQLADVEESAPTSGDNNSTDMEEPEESSRVTHTTVTTMKDTMPPAIPTGTPAGDVRPTSIWESIKWFLRYYVFAWLFPQSS